MKTRFAPMVALSLAAVFASAAWAEPAAVAKVSNGVLVDNNGMTLYTFDKDVAGSGKSACNGPCIQLWPALTAAANAQPAGDYTVVVRDDGGKQWAYQGKPLYTYVADKQVGDMKGDNFKDVWHVIKVK